MKKYKLLKVRKSDGLRRIKYLIDIPEQSIKAGDLGGLLNGYHNLSHEGNCAVLQNARIIDDAQVLHDARVSGNAVVAQLSKVYNSALVTDNATMHGASSAYGHSMVGGDAQMHGRSKVYGYALVTCGPWYRSPIMIPMEPYDICEDGDGIIKIGCQRLTYEGWMENGLEIAANERFYKRTIDRYRKALEFIHEMRSMH